MTRPPLGATTARPTALLFCPGHRPDRFDRAWRSGAPGIVLDLEDGVGAASKTDARSAVFDWLANARDAAAQSGAPLVALRINEPRSAAGLEDIYCLAHARPLPAHGWLLVPKVEDPGEIAWLAAHLGRLLPAWRLCGLIETGRGMRALPAIAQEPSLAALGFGGADLRADLGLAETFEAQLYARSRFVMESAGRGLHMLDVPHLELDLPKALHDECLGVKALGFHGKFAIHPKQLPVIMQAFAPGAQTVTMAHRIVQAYESARGNAVQLDGRMIDEPVYRQALAHIAAVTESERRRP